MNAMKPKRYALVPVQYSSRPTDIATGTPRFHFSIGYRYPGRYRWATSSGNFIVDQSKDINSLVVNVRPTDNLKLHL